MASSAPHVTPPEGDQNSARNEIERSLESTTIGARERFGAFYSFYIGLFALLFAYLTTVRIAEALLQDEFQRRVDESIVITSFERPISAQIERRIDEQVRRSAWIRWGGLRVSILVLAQDGKTWLYVDGYGEQTPPGVIAPAALLDEWMDYLPASSRVTATLPHNALASNLILIAYSTFLLVYVYATNRRLTRRETERLESALASRNQAADRAARIEEELRETRTRLTQVEPAQQEQNEEIELLQEEREELESKLARLAEREEALRGQAEQAVDLAEEVRALEDLLEEATNDLEAKNESIDQLEQNLKKASRSSGKSRSKEADRIARRFRVLYKTIEIEDQAVDHLASLGDEALKLKAEEAIKRLAEEADNVAVRRKVGGLPDHVQVFELGFAGKGRIYYARGKSRRFRIILVGAKNTQSSDLDYLRRLPKEDFS